MVQQSLPDIDRCVHANQQARYYAVASRQGLACHTTSRQGLACHIGATPDMHAPVPGRLAQSLEKMLLAQPGIKLAMVTDKVVRAVNDCQNIQTASIIASWLAINLSSKQVIL